jgi:hypothetical protein
VYQKKQIPPVIDAIWNSLFEKKISPVGLAYAAVTIDRRQLEPAQGSGHWKPMSWEKLKAAVEEGIIEIGGHGHTHTPFEWLTDAALSTEINTNQQWLQKEIKRVATSCSYPHGKTGRDQWNKVAEHYRYAFANTPIPGNAEPCNLGRYNVPFQRPNSLASLVRYPKGGKWLRKFGSVSGLY